MGEDGIIITSRDLDTTLSFFLLLHPLRGAATGVEIAGFEPMKKTVPFVTCGMSFGQNVCELMFCVNVTDLDFRVQINPVKTTNQTHFLKHVSLWDFDLQFRSTFSRIQVPRKTNDREEIVQRIQKKNFELFSHNSSFPLVFHSLLNIDMKMILSLKFSGAHFNLSIICSRILGESSTRTPSAFHQFDSVR